MLVTEIIDVHITPKVTWKQILPVIVFVGITG